MFIVSNRDVDASKTDVFAFASTPNRLGPNELRLAEATRTGGKWMINILPDEITDAMCAEVGLNRERDPSTNQAKPIFASRYVARKLLAIVNPAMLGLKKKGRNLAFFVHGFNNDVAAALDRAEAIEKNFGVEVLVFTWPANGGGVHGLASYKSDKRDALASVGALDRCLGRFYEYLQDVHAEHVKTIEVRANERFPDDAEKWDRFFTTQAAKWCPFSVSLIMHSMGNYLFKSVLKSANYRGDLLIFDNVVMTAADVNNEGHAAWVDAIQCRGRVFITINEDDVALRASRMKMGEEQKARLGHWPYQLDSTRAVYVDFTNASHVGDSHAYFEGAALKNAVVRKFFEKALNGERAEEGLPYEAARNVYRVAAKT
jgi:esterase/lipase superfamily enzyme